MWSAARPPQGAVQIVDPAVEGADHRPPAMALLAIHHPRAPVTAQVVEGPHLAILPAHHHGALSEQIEGQPVAGRGDVVDMARDLPVVQKDIVALQLEQGLTAVGPAGRPERSQSFGIASDFIGSSVTIIPPSASEPVS